MKIEQEILINQYGQEIIEIEPLISIFKELEIDDKRIFLNELLYWFIIQSKPKEEDIEFSIIASKLKPTCTPCILLKKGIENYKLEKIIKLPDNELDKVFVLFINLFRIAYKRKLKHTKNHPEKWWYWDLSDSQIISTIISKYSNS